jgi:nitrogen fixation protein FixH
MISQRNKAAMKNPWVIGLLLFFMVFLMANVTFIYLAFKEAPSLVSIDFYERGERYEETLRKAKREKQLNWTGVLLVPQKIKVSQIESYDVVIQGEQAQPVETTSTIFHAYRPSDADVDFQVMMIKQQAGLYQAEIMFPLAGSWDVIVEVKRDDQRLLLTRRLTVLP